MSTSPCPAVVVSADPPAVQGRAAVGQALVGLCGAVAVKVDAGGVSEVSVAAVVSAVAAFEAVASEVVAAVATAAVTVAAVTVAAVTVAAVAVAAVALPAVGLMVDVTPVVWAANGAKVKMHLPDGWVALRQNV